MSTTATPRTFERTVPVERLSTELARLWADVGFEVEREFGQPPQHTDILTLIAIAHGRRDERTVAATFGHLAEAHPSREIAVLISPTADAITATLSARCRMAADGRVICYEVIELRVPEDQLDAVPSILAPLELYDVPTFLWWVGEVDLASDAFLRISALAERLIIDSSRFEDGVGALRAYRAFLSRESRTCTASDLTWTRATAWRELIAQSFDNPLAVDLLWGIQSVEIDFDPDAESQALLLAGWLAARLGWSHFGAQRLGSSIVARAISAQGAPVAVALNRQSAAGVGLRSVRFLARRIDATARIAIRRRGGRLAGAVCEMPGMRQERIVPLASEEVPRLLNAELLVHTRDVVFEQSLECAARWLDAIEDEQ